MSQLSDFALEQHRVYVLRDFQQLPDGSIICAGFPRLRPDKVIAARFPNATILTAWQDHRDRSKLPWPLELVAFRAVRLSSKRFRFTLNCIDFHQEWESDWPQLIRDPNAPLPT